MIINLDTENLKFFLNFKHDLFEAYNFSPSRFNANCTGLCFMRFFSNFQINSLVNKDGLLCM